MALYHYTTETRHDQILQSGKFKPATDTQYDAAYGEGWYFTDLDPDTCEKILMHYCWQKGTLHQRVRYYFQLEVVGGTAHRRRDHVYFVPLSPFVSFRVVEHGPIPDCPLKPCYACKYNPEKT